jgi:hypothetical protein
MRNKRHSKKPGFIHLSEEIGNIEILRSKKKKINKLKKKSKTFIKINNSFGVK